QRRRLEGTSARCNAEMDGRILARHVRLEDGAAEALSRAYATGVLSARGRHRVIRVAQTIADLERHEHVAQSDLLLALSRASAAATRPRSRRELRGSRRNRQRVREMPRALLAAGAAVRPPRPRPRPDHVAAC